MARSEPEFIAWLAERLRCAAPHVVLGIGDDMSIVETGAGIVLTTSDLLADGVHFDMRTQAPADIGHKCLACSLSDCAAMAVRPLAATVSVALPRGMPEPFLTQFVDGLARTAARFACPITGGDTVVWDQPLVVDVSVNAVPYPRIAPVRRSGARVGDRLYSTGRLGGSLLGRHLSFTPRVAEARALAEALGSDLHAMMDISDGLSLDLYRLCQASGVGATLDETLLRQALSPDAERASAEDGRTALDHLLNDGEDFELLVSVAAARDAAGLGLLPIGVVTPKDLQIAKPDGRLERLEPRGYQHRV
jgi:thiamine-monophosphate kinase